MEPPKAILTAIRTVLANEIYVRRNIAARLLHRFVANSAPHQPVHLEGTKSLTERELQVLQLIGAGHSTRAIAGVFKLSVKTVETHREHLKHKLGLRSASELTQFAIGWLYRQVPQPLLPGHIARARIQDNSRPGLEPS